MTAHRSVPGAVDPAAVLSEEVTVERDGTPVRGYLARPRSGTPAPGLLVLHEAFGLNEHIRDLARRFAGAGFVALAPDLYSRTGAPDPADMPAVLEAMFALPDEQVVADLDALAAYLRGRSDVTGAVGEIGFCAGGRQVLLHACSSRAVDAAVDCWGGYIRRARPEAEVTASRPVPVIDLVPRLSCPLLAVGGVEDTNPSPADLAELETRLRAAGKPGRVRVFDGAGHAFLADYRPTYRPEAAHALWGEVIEFLRAHLVKQD